MPDAETPRYRLHAGGWQELAEAARPVRVAVFIEEQGVPRELEWDEWDAASLHAVVVDPAGVPVATGRLLPDGHIGRLAVLPAHRGRGLGRRLMQCLIIRARERRLARVELNAQVHALAFYERLGFEAKGPVFMEAGIPHRAMGLSLSGRPDNGGSEPGAGPAG